ncbi:CotH kinase family protein [Glycomyces sp. A-F 0318]|uniref:CotH kinase family protein n=1 Tax=Glycomyces amatae TaxID=2881355 RepID=UPI001E2EE222|nr:CotH kinase family protein [Glycomyces amatae]MCD0443183.1 CotH kinase family protein [Glycomyces amatae]
MRGKGGRLHHRLPVSLRHYWRLIAGSVGVVLALALVIGTVRVSALAYSDSNEGFAVNWDIEGTVDLFDTAVAHEISLEYDQDDYDDMVSTFQDSGEKEWIKADITIDGTTITDVGIRLKGNSTLSSLGGGIDFGGAEGGMEFPGGGEMPEGMEFPEGMERPEGMEFPGGGEGMEGMMGGMASLSFDEPEGLPWLVDFSKFVDGQVYQGNQQISFRVDSGMGSSSLAEATAIGLVGESGEASYDYTYSTMSVNGSEAITRRVVDVMDTTWAAEEYGAEAGVLYKARAGGDLSYQGTDPEEYEDDFKQVNMEGSDELQYIVDFLQWLDGTDDETFAAELGEWMDVESFANYAALQNLLTNGDDMAGAGSNYYLWYDYDTGLLSVITWDLDLTLSDATLAPGETASLGGFGGGGGAGGFAEGMEMPEGMEFPGGGEMAGGMGGGFGGSSGASEFKTRFIELFQDEYMSAYSDLYQRLYASGAALEALDTAQRAAGLNGADVSADAESLRAVIQERTEFLDTELGASATGE